MLTPAKEMYLINDGAFLRQYLTAFNRLLFSQKASIIDG